MVAGVGDQRVDDQARVPGDLNDDVALEEHRRDGHRKDVGDDVLDGVGVGGRQGHGRRPLVVLLVDALVEVPLVHQSVGVVEQQLLDGTAGLRSCQVDNY